MTFEPIFEIAKCQMIQRDELPISGVEEYFEPARPAFLYCILSRNRISINHEYIDFSDKHVNLEFLINNKGIYLKERFEIDHNFPDLKELKINSDYPFNDFLIRDENGTALYGGKAAYFPENTRLYPQVQNKDFLDYEILYIGQSVTEDNNVPVLKRTLAHSTYQEILEDYNRKHPDKELYTFFFSFRQKALLDFPALVSVGDRKKLLKHFSKKLFYPNN
jgi:hypothetical protein